MWPTCEATVRSAIKRAAAISALDLPRPICDATARSRAVSPPNRAASARRVDGCLPIGTTGSEASAVGVNRSRSAGSSMVDASRTMVSRAAAHSRRASAGRFCDRRKRAMARWTGQINGFTSRSIRPTLCHCQRLVGLVQTAQRQQGLAFQPLERGHQVRSRCFGRRGEDALGDVQGLRGFSPGQCEFGPGPGDPALTQVAGGVLRGRACREAPPRLARSHPASGGRAPGSRCSCRATRPSQVHARCERRFPGAESPPRVRTSRRVADRRGHWMPPTIAGWSISVASRIASRACSSALPSSPHPNSVRPNPYSA